jgi:type I restriction-modification system DNA methylase subunit/restriction endonuclease S subunit
MSPLSSAVSTPSQQHGNVQTKVPSNDVVWTIADNKEENLEYKAQKTTIDKVINQCHNLLYDNGAIVGTKAQNDIMRLLCLRILKDQFNQDSSELWEACVQVKAMKNLSDTKFNKYMKYCKDLKALTHPDLDFFKEWRFLVRDLLRDALPSVFGEEDERFNCSNYTVVLKMIEKIENGLPSSDEFRDAFSTTCGDVHEMFRAYGGGKAAKELGQFFTTRELIHSIFHGLNLPEFLTVNNDVIVYDPCMGTGGFLTRMFQLFNVQPENIYGCETEADTIKFGQMSVVLTTGKVCNNIVKCNSLSENPLIVSGTKMDAIVTNPPFGTKMKYADLRTTFEETFPDSSVKFKDVYPINTSNGACLFIQHCVHMLADKGVCAVVLPDGELFDSHSKWSAKFRKWWCENVKIRTILKVPSGVFKHAGVRTNVVVFTKDGPTTEIKYQELTDKSCTRINDLFTVGMADIVQTGYSLDHKAYLKEEGDVYDVPMVALGDVCTLRKGKHIKVADYKEGTVPVISSARQPSGTHNEANCPPNTICIAASGSYAGFIHRYNVPIWASHCITVRTNDGHVAADDYIFQVLRAKQEQLYNCRPSNAGQPNIYARNLEPFKIPLPPLETQHQIVQELQTIETNIQTLRTRTDQLKREKELFHKYGRKAELMGLWEGCEWRGVGDVCEVRAGSTLVKKDFADGEYQVIGGGQKPVGFHSVSNTEPNVICISRKGSAGFVSCRPQKIFATADVFRLLELKECVNSRFLSYCLSFHQDGLYKLQKGCAQPGINRKALAAFKIPVPTPAIQQESIAIFEAKAKHIQTLDECIQREEQHIKDLQQLGKDVIASFCCMKN